MRNAKLARAITLAALAATACGLAAAQTLYKLVDKDGKVTYVDKPPKDYEGQVIPIEIDPNRNKATLTAPGAAKTDPATVLRGKAAPGAADRLKVANERLEAARKLLADALANPRPGEVQHVGKVGGGARPVFTDDYQRRIAGLEEAVRAAEEEVRQAERAR